MEAAKTTSPTDQNRLPARRKKTNAHTRTSGFILLYSLWVLTAISLALAVVAKQKKHSASTAQLNYALQKRQIINILDYVVRNSYQQKINNDSRLNQYQQQIKQKRNKKTDDKLEYLKALLKQMGMKLDLNQTGKKTQKQVGQLPTNNTQQKKPQLGFFHTSSQPYAVKAGQQTYTISIKPANAYPNLNTLPAAQLTRYLQYLGLTPQKARQFTDRLIDWIDPDKFVHGRYGAEWSQYSKQMPPYKPSNNPLKTWQEINYIYQASPAFVELLQQHFVLHGQEKVIADYLSDAAIAALANVNKTQVKKWREQKQGKKPRITEKEQKKIEAVIGHKVDENSWIIQIENSPIKLTAWYNWKKRILQDWTITIGAVAIPLTVESVENKS